MNSWKNLLEIDTIVGHSYFGQGKIIEIVDEEFYKVLFQFDTQSKVVHHTEVVRYS